MSDSLNSLNDALTQKEEPSLFKSAIGMIGTLIAFPLAAKVMMGGMYRANLGAGRALMRLTESSALNRFATHLTTHGETSAAKNVGRTIFRTSNTLAELGSSAVHASMQGGNSATLSHGMLSDPGVYKNLSENRFFMKGATRFQKFNTQADYKFATSNIRNTADLRLTTLLSHTRTFQTHPFIQKFMQGAAKMETDASLILGKENRSMFTVQDGAMRQYGRGKVAKSMAWTFMKKSASTLPAYYALDAMMGRTDGKWYDPRTMARWAGQMGMFEITMAGLGPMAKFAGHGLRKGVVSGGAGLLKRNTGKDLITKAFEFAEGINNRVGRVSGAVGALGLGIKGAREDFRIGELSTYKKYAQGFIDSTRNFASNIADKQYHSHKLIRARESDFGHMVQDSGKIFNTADGGKAAKKAMEETFGHDHVANTFMTNLLNDVVEKSGKSTAASKAVRGSFTEATLKNGESFKFMKGRGMVNYKGRDFNLSNLVPGHIANSLLGVAAAHLPGSISGMGITRMKQSSDTRDAYVSMGSGASVQLSQSFNVTNLFKTSQQGGAGDDMYQYFRAKAVEGRANWMARYKGLSQEEANIKAHYEVGGVLDRTKEAIRTGAEIDPKLKQRGMLWMKKAVSRTTKRGIIETGEDESMFMLSGKVFINKKNINAETGKYDDTFSTFRVGTHESGEQLKFDYFDRESIGNWSKGIDANKLAYNTRYNELHRLGSTDANYMSKSFMVKPKGNQKGFTGWLNRTFNWEIGNKHEKTIWQGVSDSVFRFWDTTNVRTFSAKGGALEEGVLHNRINLRKGKATKNFNDQINYAKTITGMRDDIDVHIAHKFDEDPETFLKAVGHIKGTNNNTYMEKGMHVDDIRNLAEHVKKTFEGYRRSPPNQLQEVLARMSSASDATVDNLFKPGGYSSKYESASVAGEFNMLMAKHRIVEEAYGNHPAGKEVIDRKKVQEFFDEKIKKVTDPREALILKGISLSRSLTDVSFTSHTGANLAGTRGVGVSISKMRKLWADTKDQAVKDKLGITIQNMNSDMLEALRLEGHSGSMYYGDVISEFAENSEKIKLAFNMSRKNLAVHGLNEGRPTFTLIARNKQDKSIVEGGKLTSLGGMFKSFTDEDVEKGAMTFTTNQMSMYGAMNSVNQVAHMIGLGFDQHSTPDVQSFMSKLVMKRILPGVAMYQAYQTADAKVADSQFLQGTALGHGLTPFFGGFVAKGHIAAQTLMDVTGVTAGAKYMEDLMPGSINSPLAGAVRGFGAPLGGMAMGMKMGGPTGSLIGGAIGAGISLITAGGPLGTFGAYDITQGRDKLIDEYLGYTDNAVKKARWWDIGSGPMQGEGVSFFTKNWFAQMNASPESTGVLYGNKSGKLAFLMGKHDVEQQNMYSRPYPWSGGIGENVPLIGKTFQVGGGYSDVYTENVQYMQDPFAGHITNKNSFTPIAGGTTGFGLDQDTKSAAMLSHNLALNPSSQTTYGSDYGEVSSNMEISAATPSDLRIRSRTAFQTMSELAGLRGWMGGMMYAGATGQQVPFEDVPVLQSSSEMTSPTRTFWDAEMGNVFGLGEFGRRLLQRDPGWTEKVNQISNLMPAWLPNDLRVGDPYCLHPNTLVEIQEGIIKKAKDVIVGDLIRNIDGRLVPVSYIVIRQIGDKEKVYQFKVATIPGFPFTISEEHPLWISRNDEGQWIQAQNVEVGDYVGYPLLDTSTPQDIVIDLADFEDRFHIDEDTIWLQYKPNKDTVKAIKLLEQRGSLSFERGERKQWLKENNIAAKSLEWAQRAIRIGNARTDTFPRFIQMNEDLAIIIGYYLSEGYLNRDQEVGFAFNANEEHTFIAELDESIFRVFGKRGNIDRNDTNGIQYRVSCSPMAIFLRKYVGSGFDQKKIPEQIMQYGSPAILRNIIRTTINGDGSYFFDKQRFVCSLKMTNPELLYQIRRILLRYRIVASIQHDPTERAFVTTNGKVSHTHGSWNLKLATDMSIQLIQWLIDGNITHETDDSNGKMYWFDSNFIYLRVNEKNETGYKDEVYGYQVDDSASFCVVGALTHNTRTKQGESRLPGAGYETLNNVSYDMPGYAELLGKDPEEIYAEYTGQKMPVTEDQKYGHFGRPVANRYADMLSEQNNHAKRNVQFYNPQYDFTAKADIVINDENGKLPVNVKMVSQGTFDKLNSARVTDSSEMNAVLWTSRAKGGQVIYISPQGESKQFAVEFDGRRLEEDMGQLRQVQEAVKQDLMDHGIKKRYNMALSYSQADKMKILANVAPYSDEYFYAKHAAQARLSLGVMTDEEKEKYYDAMDQREQIMQKFDFYKPKFYNVGTAATVQEMQRQEEVGSKYNAVEKMVGTGWEYMLQLRTPISAKMIHNETAVARYERTVAFGKDFKSWDNPYQDYVQPLVNNSMQASDPVEGAIGFGAMGALLGGPGMGVVGMGLGAAHALVAGGSYNLPDRVVETRKAEWALDNAKYQRAQMLLSQTGDKQYEEEMNQTMTSINQRGGRAKMGDIMRALPKTEKAYFKAFSEASTVEERERILRIVPEYIKPMLLAKWNGGDSDYQPNVEDIDPTQFTDQLYDKNLRMDDLRLKLYQREGLDAREAGVGFYSQNHRLIRQGKLASSMSINNYSSSKKNNDPNSAIQGTVGNAASIIGNLADDAVMLAIKIR